MREELKTYDFPVDHGDFTTTIELFYLKSEADKVIAGLEDKLREQTYKRCLGLAMGCRLRARWFGDNAFYKKEQWALQWHKRWLELAEKFKEAK